MFNSMKDFLLKRVEEEKSKTKSKNAIESLRSIINKQKDEKVSPLQISNLRLQSREFTNNDNNS